MGASYQEEYAKTDSKVMAEKTFNQAQKDALEEYGHGDGYSGSFYGIGGWSWSDKPIFNDYTTASDWIADNTEKWGNGIVVRVKDPACNKRFSKVRERYVQEYENALNHLKNGKNENEKQVSQLLRQLKEDNKFYKCKKCKSNLSCQYLSQMVICPLCKNKFSTPETEKELVKLEKSVERALKKLEKNKPNYYWLVGGWSAE